MTTTQRCKNFPNITTRVLLQGRRKQKYSGLTIEAVKQLSFCTKRGKKFSPLFSEGRKRSHSISLHLRIKFSYCHKLCKYGQHAIELQQTNWKQSHMTSYARVHPY